VLAAAAGEVALAAHLYFAGKAVIVDHGAGLFTMYFHLHEITVGNGDRIERGQTLGTVGTTGRVTGAHLHFGARWNGARIDPSLLLAPIEDIPTIGSPPS
jgi:murein DD-endopeptidase MepM/ murein hydrolase activator NlpD